jgi:hypothetical protein
MEKIFDRPSIDTQYFKDLKQEEALKYIQDNMFLYLDNQLKTVERERFEKHLMDHKICLEFYLAAKKKREWLNSFIPYKKLDSEEAHDLVLEVKEVFNTLYKPKRKKAKLSEKLGTFFSTLRG